MMEGFEQFVGEVALAVGPAELFCKMLGRLPEPGRQVAVKICGEAIGCTQDIADASFEAKDPIRELFRPPTIVDVRKKLIALLAQQHLSALMLMPGGRISQERRHFREDWQRYCEGSHVEDDDRDFAA
jgi:hypothetical protein